MNIAVIPARGGSKRIPGKNIRPFFGKPMIQHSIDAALGSGLFERVLVTTDSPEIAEVAIRAGAQVPMLRPAELSDDHTPTIPVLLHALREMAPKSTTYDYACCILATAPLIQVKSLLEGYELIRGRRASSVIAVTDFGYPIFRAFKQGEKGNLEWVWPEYALARSNDLPATFHDAGQFYWLDAQRFLTTEKILAPDTAPLHLPRHLVQ
ncbi:MAG: pseudaminic acid cytidylyltransferase, partial [Bdellovibrionota bacterium]